VDAGRNGGRQALAASLVVGYGRINRTHAPTIGLPPISTTRPMLVPEPSVGIASTAKLDCVANLTTKIEGDDSAYIMDVFEEFLDRKTSGPEKSLFLAVLWLHTNHEPHPALPQFYHNYTDVFGDPAGDYLGTLTQVLHDTHITIVTCTHSYCTLRTCTHSYCTIRTYTRAHTPLICMHPDGRAGVH
jgi:hypothetical protein